MALKSLLRFWAFEVVWFSTGLLPTKRLHRAFEQNLNFGFCPTRCPNVFLTVVIHPECRCYRNEPGKQRRKGYLAQSQILSDWPELTQATFLQPGPSQWSQAYKAIIWKGCAVRQNVFVLLVSENYRNDGKRGRIGKQQMLKASLIFLCFLIGRANRPRHFLIFSTRIHDCRQNWLCCDLGSVCVCVCENICIHSRGGGECFPESIATVAALQIPLPSRQTWGCSAQSKGSTIQQKLGTTLSRNKGLGCCCCLPRSFWFPGDTLMTNAGRVILKQIPRSPTQFHRPIKGMGELCLHGVPFQVKHQAPYCSHQWDWLMSKYVQNSFCARFARGLMNSLSKTLTKAE